jgi:hypothetical protein
MPGGVMADAPQATCRRQLRLVRSLLLTPWFAAGAGVVIAAALAVDSPAALTYAPNSPGLRCAASGCVRPSPGHAPALATASPGVPFLGGGGTRRRDGPAASPGAPPATAAVYQLGYQVVQRWTSGFVAVITLPGNAKPGAWNLQLSFPSARVDRVWGALWQPSGQAGAGTALGPWPGRGQGQGRPGSRQLILSATGVPTSPSDCRLDGSACSFEK